MSAEVQQIQPVKVRIQPHSGWRSLDVAELIQYRRLLGILAWRDVRARYKQTFAGMTWVIIQPLLTMVVFSVVFGGWLQLPSADSPYPVFAFCGLVPWTYFVHALTMSSSSIVANQPIITKVYFPRMVLPLASVLGGLVDIATSLLVLIPLLWFYDIAPGVSILMLPLFVVLAGLTAFAAGVWLSAINVRFRDVAQALPFGTQLWMFCTPVVYSIDVVPEKWQFLFYMNPMTTVIEGFRWSLSGGLLHLSRWS